MSLSPVTTSGLAVKALAAIAALQTIANRLEVNASVTVWEATAPIKAARLPRF